MTQIDLAVPDLGGFSDIPVIEILVKPGDTVKVDDPLVTLESDKATMEVPSAAAGTIKELRVKVGDKVSQGSVLATADAVAVQPPVPTPQAPTPQAQAASSSQATSESVVEIVVPDIGGFSDIPVIEVLVKAGDTVAKEAALVTLESDKATMEIPSSSGGVIRDVKVKVGDKVSQGTVIATVATQSADAASASASSAAEAAPASPASATAPAPPAAAPAAQVRQPEAPRAPRPAVSTAPAPAAAPGISPNGSTNGATGGAPVHASPAIRRFARELGADLSRIKGSGPNGRITREDVQTFVKSTLASPPATNGAPATATAGGGLDLQLPPWPKVDFAKFGPVERVPLTRIQRLSGPALARNWVMIPHVTQNDDADVSDLEAFRKQINGERKDGAKVTMLAFLMKAAVAALKRYPALNSSLDGHELVLKHYYHLGFAADTPNGLLVPVIKDVDKKGLVEIATETAELAAKARDGKLGPADMTGATFTISSLGSIGGTYFTPIINAPEVAILGACRADIRPVWDGTQFVPRLIQPLSLSYDHRVVDGAQAARFCVAVKESLADLRRTLL